MDLFDYMRKTSMKDEAPLAKRLRPTSLEEIVGQKHILGEDKLLYRVIKADKLSSIILYGPPGTGKTTVARMIAGILLRPAIREALTLLSPAIISNLSCNLLTTKGCIIPCSLIESASSFKASVSKVNLG